MTVKVSHHLHKFCGHRYCGSGEIMVLVCHVILEEHVIKGWSNIMGRGKSRQVTSLPSLVAIGTVVVKI